MKAFQSAYWIVLLTVVFMAACSNETAVENATGSGASKQISAAGKIRPGVTGGGTFECYDAVNDEFVIVTHGFDLRCTGRPNRLELNWNGNRFFLEFVDDRECEQEDGDSEITILGEGRLNGESGAAICAGFEDGGEPGGEVDRVDVIIVDGNINSLNSEVCEEVQISGDLFLDCHEAVAGGGDETSLISGNHEGHF